MVAAKKVVAKKSPIRKAPVKRAKPVQKQDMTDKVLDLIKWVDNPFKLVSVILLSTIAFIGYLTWDSRQVILAAISSNSTMPQLKTHEQLLPLATKLVKDINAVGIVVNKVNLATNSRTTVLALANGERNHKLEGVTVSLFAASPERNADIVSMLNNEVACKPFESSSPVGEWAKSQGVTYMCRASIPNEIGKFAGYIAVGFKSEPQDLNSVKTRMILTATEMDK
jgi:translation initiation factor 2 gamma subunit (eIF-2gamma)